MGGSRRRGDPPSPIPSANLGNPAQRRRLDNSDRVNTNPNPRRRTNDGWEVDSQRRRGYSGTTVALAATLGFGGGIVLGNMINSGDHHYYQHTQGWTDSNGVRHEPGYYSEEGYYYAQPQEFGYCPPFGQAGYVENCGANVHQDGGGGGGDGDSGIAGLIILVCCCCCCIVAMYSMSNSSNNSSNKKPAKYNQQQNDDEDEGEDQDEGDEDEDESNEGDVVTMNGDSIPRADAVGFIQAVQSEYVDLQQGALGDLYEKRNFLEEVQERLQCEEDAIRASDDPQDAVVALARRWRMMSMIQHG